MDPERAVMRGVLRHMNPEELQFCRAWLERRCQELGGNVMAMEKYEKRLTEVKAEWDRRQGNAR